MSEPLFKPYDVAAQPVHPSTQGKAVPEAIFNSANDTAKALNDHWDTLNTQHSVNKAKLEAPDSKWATSTDGQAAAQTLKETGGKFETAAARLQAELEASKKAAVATYETGVASAANKAEIDALAKARDKALAEVAKDQEHLTCYRTEAKVLGGHEHIGGGPSGALETATSAVGAAASVGGKIYRNTPEAVKLGVIGEEGMKGKNFVQKIMANVKANVNVASIDKSTGVITESKFLGKSMKVGGAALGVIISGYGLKDLGQVMGIIGADTDEKGQEIPADGGKLFKAAAELAGGAAVTYLTVLKGGKALGLAK